MKIYKYGEFYFKEVSVAIIGVENCASSFVQGVHFYRNAKDGDSVHFYKIALDRKLSSPIIAPSAYFKTLPKQFKDSICLEMTEAFIKGDEKK